MLKIRDRLNFSGTNEGELAAFITQAMNAPEEFLTLIDTYSVLSSGLPNFICVALALKKLGYAPIGVRIDSGDLADLSRRSRLMLDRNDLAQVAISLTNEITPEVIIALAQQGCHANAFGAGTHLITCREEPSLGCVYKLVEIGGQPRMKNSETIGKVVISGRKTPYRLFDSNGQAVADLMMQYGEDAPIVSERTLCRHPFIESQRMYVRPTQVLPLHELYWNGGLAKPVASLKDARRFLTEQIQGWRPDHLRFQNPTPYKVSVSPKLYRDFHALWEREVPIVEFR